MKMHAQYEYVIIHWVLNHDSAVDYQTSGKKLTNPIFIFDVDVSSFLDKAFHCVVTNIASCNMQVSPLKGETNSKKEYWSQN